MKKYAFCLAIFIFVACTQKTPLTLSTTTEEPALISFSSEAGMEMLRRSNANSDFFLLANYFESQLNRVFCGPATIAIVLNALRIDELRADKITLVSDKISINQVEDAYFKKDFNPYYNLYTQENVFDVSYIEPKKPVSFRTKKEILGAPMKNKKAYFGMSLQNIVEMFQAHGVKTQKVSGDQIKNHDSFRKILIENLRDSTDFIVVNYARKSLGQPGGGHISPVGAYHKQSDRFLVMDVTPHKADWVWVKTKDLIAALNTRPGEQYPYRGYVLVKDQPENTFLNAE